MRFSSIEGQRTENRQGTKRNESYREVHEGGFSSNYRGVTDV